MAENPGPLPETSVALLFRELMSACLALERTLEVAFLGPEGTFTEAAGLKHFGHAVRSRPLATIGEVFQQVEAGQVDYAVVPVASSREGLVSHSRAHFSGPPAKCV